MWFVLAIFFSFIYKTLLRMTTIICARSAVRLITSHLRKPSGRDCISTILWILEKQYSYAIPVTIRQYEMPDIGRTLCRFVEGRAREATSWIVEKRAQHWEGESRFYLRVVDLRRFRYPNGVERVERRGEERDRRRSPTTRIDTWSQPLEKVRIVARNDGAARRDAEDREEDDGVLR